MPIASWSQFRGTIPRRAALFLPEGAAQRADDCKLLSGEIRPFGAPVHEETPITGSATRKIYRYVNSGAASWFAWASLVHIAEAPLSSDSKNRRFYTGDGRPKKTGNDIGIPAGASGVLPAAWYWMGVKNPYQVPTIDNQVGGSGNQETVNYVFTHVTGWGEESGPSEPSADFTAFINRTSLRFTRPTPSFTFVDADVDTAADTIAEGAWEGDSATKINAYARVRLTTSGVLPAGLALAVDYWTVPTSDAGKFKLASSYANALAGVVVDITGAAGGGTHTITQYTPDGRYNIVSINIYRSNSGTEGAAFLFVSTLAIDTGTTTQVTDNIAASALGEALETTDYAEPPTDMIGLGSLPNGMLFGVSPDKKQLCLSAPYDIYAWPDTVDYRRILHFTPRACGAVGTSIVVATDGKPYVFRGVEPGAITGDAEDALQAILNAASLVETSAGVLWASPDGLYLPGQGIVSRSLYTKDEWKTLRPESMICEAWDARVYVAYDATNTGHYEVLVIDPLEQDALGSTLKQDTPLLYADILSDTLYMLLEGEIKRWDADPLNPLTWTYRTGIKRDAFPNNKSVAQVVGDFGGGSLGGGQSLADYNTARAAILDYNADIGTYDSTGKNSAYNPIAGAPGMAGAGEVAAAGDLFLDVPPQLDSTVTFRLYGDATLRHTKVVTNEKPFTLPPGYRAVEWAVELSASSRVRIASVANARKELGSAP